MYSLSSLAQAVGPVSLRCVYSLTKNRPYPGPGTMFFAAALLYVLAAVCAFLLPEDRANSSKMRTRRGGFDDDAEGESAQGQGWVASTDVMLSEDLQEDKAKERICSEYGAALL